MDFISQSDELRELILNTTEPLKLKNIFTTEILQWDLKDWDRILKNEDLLFRHGLNANTKHPQWERSTPIKKGNFQDFLDVANLDDSKTWLYFDYKQLMSWLKNANEIRNLDMGLNKLGFHSLSIDDFVIWIGSKGAHTPCHSDTYSCNLIFQIYGRKQWMLFPPNEDLLATRIPYEESSVYSKLNFFSPTVEEFKGIGNARRIVLNPGDILVLPHKWWHFVENLETAISMNVWLPLPIDNKRRLEESLVQLFMKQFTGNVTPNARDIIFNPDVNSDVFSESPVQDFIAQVNLCKDIYKKDVVSQKEEKTLMDLAKIIDKYDFIQRIDEMSSEDFTDFLQQQRSRFQEVDDSPVEEISSDLSNTIHLLQAMTHPDVISSIRRKLVHQ